MSSWTRGGEALTDLILETFRVNGDLISEGDRIAGEFGQSSARWQVLGAIDAEAETVPGIARTMGLTRQSVQRTVDLLEGDGLVQYLANPAHRRSKLVAMTGRGRKIYEAISAEQVDWVNQLASDIEMRVQDIRNAVQVLRSLGTALEESKGND
jgi:DNA-binding MarR family transcriptional regulator